MITTFTADSEDGLAHAAAGLLAGALARAVEDGRPASLMLSGGASPPRIIALLASTSLPWDRISLFASDERCVSADHPDSTEGMIRRAFNGRPVHYIAPPSFDVAGAEAWWREIAQSPPPAAGLIGIGADGHTASLFPGRPEESDAMLGALHVPETAPHKHPRLTLTAPALRCDVCVLLANSPAKLAALDAASTRNAPIARVLQASGESWILRLPAVDGVVDPDRRA